MKLYLLIFRPTGSLPFSTNYLKLKLTFYSIDPGAFILESKRAMQVQKVNGVEVRHI